MPPPPAMTRALALLCILIALAPLGSLYGLFKAVKDPNFSGGSQTFVYLSSTKNPDSPSLGALLQTNATVEEVVRAIFKEAMVHQAPHAFGSVLYMGTGGGPFVRMHLFTLIMPWFVSFLLGVVVPSILALASYVRNRNGGNTDGESEADRFFSKLKGGEKRLARLILCVRHFKKEIDKNDIVDAFCSSNGEREFEGGESSRFIILPAPGTTHSEEEKNSRRVPGQCAVCLSQYNVGDTVIWASTCCQHAFHEKCILTWLVRKRRTCPCCRQAFVDRDVYNSVGSQNFVDE